MSDDGATPRECPFCGSKNCAFVRALWFVSCAGCGATGPGAHRRRGKAIAGWNTRAAQPHAEALATASALIVEWVRNTVPSWVWTPQVQAAMDKLDELNAQPGGEA